MNRYEFEIKAKCPNGKLGDVYACSIESERTIMPVETIVLFIQSVEKRKIFQEDLADELRNEFQCRATVIGWHFGVKIICTRE